MSKIDLLVIGGGINGCGIARDAAGRGLSVTLCDMDDIASATSSWSSKLIHGGLRYLENYEFKLVREALKEREILMHSAPFIIHPLEFILPYEKHLRSPWILRIGLFMYDHLSKRKTIPGSGKVTFTANDPANALKDQFTFGFNYYDCQTNDARLTLLNALDAYEQGASVLTHTKCTALENKGDHWQATLHDTLSDTTTTLLAHAVVNATGPWVSATNEHIAQLNSQSHVHLVKGSHIIVPKLYEGGHAYILQNKDGRIVFAIPYQNEFTLIGTTDVDYHGDPENVDISPDEITYLCDLINYYFKKSVTPEQIIYSYSGLRPLYNNEAQNPSKITREYRLEMGPKDHPPYLSVFGGKITTFRVLSEDALNLLSPYFPKAGRAWTQHAFLPGGDLKMPWDDFLTQSQARYPWLPATQLKRYAMAYGTNLHYLMGDSTSLDELGKHFGADLYENEVLYWVQNEWAQSADDMLWRRSKLILFLTDAERETLEHYLQTIDGEPT